jgi:hypothetical protein
MKIVITLDLFDECADPGDATGVTEEVHTEISTFLGSYGDDVAIEKAD